MAGLNRDIVKLNSILRLKRGQETSRAPEAKRPRMLASALPEWIKAGASCCYVSKTQGSTHRVKVQKLDERQQLVTIVFEENKQIWKKVPFAECAKSLDGTLRPVWKAPEQVSTCAGPPSASVSSSSGSSGRGAAAPAPAATLQAVGQVRAAAKGGPSPTTKRKVEEVVSSDEGAASPAPNRTTASTQDPYGLLSANCQAIPKLVKAKVTPNLLVPRAVALSKGKKVEAGTTAVSQRRGR